MSLKIKAVELYEMFNFELKCAKREVSAVSDTNERAMLAEGWQARFDLRYRVKLPIGDIDESQAEPPLKIELMKYFEPLVKRIVENKVETANNYLKSVISRIRLAYFCGKIGKQEAVARVVDALRFCGRSGGLCAKFLQDGEN